MSCCQPDVSFVPSQCCAYRRRIGVSGDSEGRVSQSAGDASRVCSLTCKNRWVPIRIQASSTDCEDSIRHCGFFWCCTKNILDGAFVFNLLQLLWGKVGG
ncbi:hypothetical protein TcCL_ESM09148 [Trypanosoma cruzi]|nr:hypothetical protein TcCL_ESM09148 [Trypanosoma cruzi]